ncbi:MAG TPA: hypothetical protein VE991_00850, partial [Acidimicrobiales bacterium]|nr:hypothetical protein [Acidimicrobiales bacterium]
MGRGDVLVIDDRGFDALLGALAARGFTLRGPVVRDGAIVPGPVANVDDLPRGWRDEQAPGDYRLSHGDDPRYFTWAVGPGSWKAEVFPPTQELWRARVENGERVVLREPQVRPAPVAVVGARPCELVGLQVLDRVLAGGSDPDPRYSEGRRSMFVVAVECGAPAATCFCTSMGTGPAAGEGVDGAGFDLALTELLDEGGHRFL